MKRIITLGISIILILSTIAFGEVAIGEKAGDLLQTDIVTEVNGEIIDSYNINGTTAIFAKDLRKLGFLVKWDPENRKVNVSWEGILNSPTNTTTIKGQVFPLKEVYYSDKIKIELPEDFSGIKSLMLTDSNGKTVQGTKFKKINNELEILNTYYLQLGKKFKIKGISASGEVFEQPLTVKENLIKESFTTSEDGRYKIITVPANPEKGFHFPYFLTYQLENWTTRSGMTFEDTKPILFLSASNHGVDSSFEMMMALAKDRASSTFGVDIARETKYNGFNLNAVFPRVDDYGGIYTHSLDRQTVFGTKDFLNGLGRGNLYRIDKQYIEMQKDAREHLASMGKDVGQPILTGFSAGSDFVSRINYLHPDLAKAVIINDAPTMPLLEHNGVELKFPLGMADIHEITGVPFNKAKYLDTPQFWTTGAHDTNDGVYFQDGWGTYELNPYDKGRVDDWNKEGTDYRRAFGDEIISRKEYIRELLVKEGFNNIEFHVYDTGHSITEQTLVDIEKFLDKILD